MSEYADNLRKAIINTGKRFAENARAATKVRLDGRTMNRDDIDTLWQQALTESIKAGEQFTRYHFANLVAAAEREACANVVEQTGIEGHGTLAAAVMIRARGRG